LPTGSIPSRPPYASANGRGKSRGCAVGYLPGGQFGAGGRRGTEAFRDCPRRESGFSQSFCAAHTVRFSVPQTGPARLVLHAPNGLRCLPCLREARKPGRCTRDLNSDGLSSGVYVLRLTSNQQVTIINWCRSSSRSRYAGVCLPLAKNCPTHRRAIFFMSRAQALGAGPRRTPGNGRQASGPGACGAGGPSKRRMKRFLTRARKNSLNGC
jgi:hypothetical protein